MCSTANREMDRWKSGRSPDSPVLVGSHEDRQLSGKCLSLCRAMAHVSSLRSLVPKEITSCHSYHCSFCPFPVILFRYIFEWFCLTAGQGVDAPLSETGFRQAAAAGQFLSNVQFTHAFSSDLTRTKQVSSGYPARLMGQELNNVELKKNLLLKPAEMAQWVKACWPKFSPRDPCNRRRELTLSS